MATAQEIRARRREQAKRLRAENSWLNDWYANSAGGSVIADYESGNVRVIDADKVRADRKAAKEKELAEAEAAYRKAKGGVDDAYWLFTRCAKGQPVSAELARKSHEARERMMEIKRELDRMP